MGLLDKLWDDTVAGPRPDSGLGKLRKFPTFVAPRIDTSGKGWPVLVARSGGGLDPMPVLASVVSRFDLLIGVADGGGVFLVSAAEVTAEFGNGRASGGGEDSPEDTTPRVTRSIMIKRPTGSPAATPPESPAGSTPPLSPFFGTDLRKTGKSGTVDAAAQCRGTAAVCALLSRMTKSSSAPPREREAPRTGERRGGGLREWNRVRRKSTSDAFDRGAAGGSGSGSTIPTTPTAGVQPSRVAHPPFELCAVAAAEGGVRVCGWGLRRLLYICIEAAAAAAATAMADAIFYL
ncbi:hypothetical protein Taro_009736 [Colocasia esculenta]|uniref:Uncharacterized protein n=1 Tax=Colocasia esculenta TaxID=4460 RepID=A0A843U6H2_COLES|nr:hypothetical protein [Colocasia esculenta]